MLFATRNLTRLTTDAGRARRALPTSRRFASIPTSAEMPRLSWPFAPYKRIVLLFTHAREYQIPLDPRQYRAIRQRHGIDHPLNRRVLHDFLSAISVVFAETHPHGGKRLRGGIRSPRPHRNYTAPSSRQPRLANQPGFLRYSAQGNRLAGREERTWLRPPSRRRDRNVIRGSASMLDSVYS
jgi:hypothetical protein